MPKNEGTSRPLRARRKRFVVDTSVLVSSVNSADEFHLPCYQWIRERIDEGALFVVPGLAFFEFQAAQSSIYRARERSPVYRELRLHDGNARLYPINRRFLARVNELELYDRFSMLKGADLLFACIARVESLPLATRDTGFDQYSRDIEIINPEREWPNWRDSQR